MQAKDLQLKGLRVASMPIVDRFVERMRLREALAMAIANDGYVDALLLLLKNVLIERSALYAIEDWAGQFDPRLVSGGKIGDDLLAIT